MCETSEQFTEKHVQKLREDAGSLRDRPELNKVLQKVEYGLCDYNKQEEILTELYQKIG